MENPLPLGLWAQQEIQQNYSAPKTRRVYEDETGERYVASLRTAKCFFCGNRPHSRSICPAREAICNKCKKKGHYQRVCRSSASINNDSKQSAYITLAASKYAGGKA